MDNNQKKNYNYKYFSIYLDMDNPYQKECCELLNKVAKKKSLFLGLLAHNFIEQFNNSSELTAEDLKNYINCYETMSKLKPFPQITPHSSVNNEVSHNDFPVSTTAPVPASVPVPEPTPVTTPDPIVYKSTSALPTENKSAPNVDTELPEEQDQESVKRAMSAISAFSVG